MELMANAGPLCDGPAATSPAETFWLLASAELHHVIRVDKGVVAAMPLEG